MTTPRSVSCPRIEARFEGLLIYNSFAYIRFPRERRYGYGAGSRVTKGRRVSSQTTAHQYSGIARPALRQKQLIWDAFVYGIYCWADERSADDA